MNHRSRTSPLFLKFLSRLAALGAVATIPFAVYAKDKALPGEETLRLNQVQVVGTHNSYKQPVDPRVWGLAEPAFKRMIEAYMSRMDEATRKTFLEEHPSLNNFREGLEYDHPSLSTQLDAGLRGLEIDVNADPQGGRFLHPVAYDMLRKQGVTDLAPHDATGLDKPGLKVLHVADVDFRSSCPTFASCLTQLRAWSDKNPGHAPVFVMIEVKDQDLPLFPDGTKLAPFDKAAFEELDATAFRVLGRDHLVIPDDVRGDRATLREGVLAGGWPTLARSRGKFVFMISTSGQREDALAPYLDGHASLKGRAMFLQARPADAHAAFLLIDNALQRRAEIEQAVKDGFLVRSRADIDTAEARSGDVTRRDAALASGAQVISTDFFRPGNSFGTSYIVKPFESGARLNPINGSGARR
jgi:hypothetical protein